MSKRKCNRHYCWEKLRRAEVDLERVRVVGQILYVPHYILPVHELRCLHIAFRIVRFFLIWLVGCFFFLIVVQVGRAV